MIALRVVIDTNIVVSAALKPAGTQRTALLLATTRPARLFVSAAILAEYGEVLARPELKIDKGDRRKLLQYIRRRARVVEPQYEIAAARDPDDNIFLECADAAHADYLVTGNLRHFPAYWKRTKVISSNELLQIVAPHLLPV